MNSVAPSLALIALLFACAAPPRDGPVLELPPGVEEWWYTVAEGGRGLRVNVYASRKR